MRKILIPQMTWKDIKEIMDEVEVVIVPTGSIEQHGPHLPLWHDISSSAHIAEKAAEKLYPKVLVAPPIPFGFSPHHMHIPGTISLKIETFTSIIFDVCNSLKQHGFKKILILNGHGGNNWFLFGYLLQLKNELDLEVALVNYWDVIPSEASNVIEDKQIPGHASEFETSMALVMYPDLIRRDQITVSEGIKFPSYQSFIVRGGGEYVKTGVHSGDPKLATSEKGEKIINAAVKGLVSFLSEFIKFGNKLPEK